MAIVRQGDNSEPPEEGATQLAGASPLALGRRSSETLPGYPNVGRSGVSWMVSFTDLVALLLTFFVMVFAMRDVEEDTWQTITDSFVTALDTMNETEIAAPTFDIDIEKISTAEGQDLDYLRAVIESLLRDRSAPPITRLEIRGQAVAIRAKRVDLLRPDRLALSESGKGYVFHLAGVLANLPNAVKLVVQVPGRAAAAPNSQAWADALRIGGLVTGALTERGYKAPIETRAAQSRYRTAPSQATVDILILPDARN